MTFLQQTFLLLTLWFATGCIINDESPIESYSNSVNLVQSGDIVVVNDGNDTILLLDSNGAYKDVLVNEITSAAIRFDGLSYDGLNKQLLFAHDSTVNGQDRIKSISLYDGSIGDVINDAGLNGILRGMARLSAGDLVVIEGTNLVEKFNSSGTRVGNPFLGGLTATVIDLSELNTGGFVICNTNTTTNTVQTYNVSGVLQATARAASPAPALANMAASSCAQDALGRIVVAYSGTTDSVRAYDATLTSVIWTFSNTAYLSTPGKIAFRANGNILVSDTALHHIVEIDPNGNFVRILGGTVLATPRDILVVP
jgi:hypothetical protein